MGRAGALIGLVVALLCPAGASAQVSGSDARQLERTWPVINLQAPEPTDSTASATRPDFFLLRDSPTVILDHPQIYRLSYDTLPSAYAPQGSAQAYPPDVADRVVTVWVVKYR
jgi:hypothetical protein